MATITAVLTPPAGIQTTDFGIQIVFGSPVTDFGIGDVTIAPADTEAGNGITGLSYSLGGAEATYTIYVRLPVSEEGKIKVSLAGKINANADDADSNEVTVSYCTYPLLRKFEDAENLTSAMGVFIGVELMDNCINSYQIFKASDLINNRLGVTEGVKGYDPMPFAFFPTKAIAEAYIATDPLHIFNDKTKSQAGVPAERIIYFPIGI